MPTCVDQLPFDLGTMTVSSESMHAVQCDVQWNKVIFLY